MCRNYLIILMLISCIIHSSLQIDDDVWYSYQFDSGHGNRKELYISKVDAVDNFQTQENVLEWRSLSLKDRSYALGLTRTGVTVLQIVPSHVANDKINESFSTNETHTPMNASVFDASIFKYWNEETSRTEIIAVVAVGAQNSINAVDLLWFRVTGNNKLINISKWSLQKKISHLNVFKLDNKYNILIANERYENYTTADWYEFHLGQHKDFWLKQAIRLETPTNSTTISTFGAKTFLSIPQKENLRIFELVDSSHFVTYLNFSVGFVSFVTSFKVGFESFIAIDGDEAGIYKFTNGIEKLEKQSVENANLHNIDYWLSIPICTYRDEEVLIAERTLDFTTHKSHAIQAIIHHGGKFVLHDEMTCDYYGDVSNGLNCLVEEDNSATGIMGSAFFTVNDTLGVLVPRHNKTSGLFVIHTEMKELKSPLQKRMKSLDDKRAKLQEKINRFKANEENKRFPKKKTILAEPIPASSNLDVEAVKRNRTTQVLLGQSAPLTSDELNVEELTARVSKLQVSINEMLKDLPKIPSLQPNVNQYDTLVINGLVEVQGPSNIKDVITNTFNGATTDAIVNQIYNTHDNRPLTGHKTFVNLRTDSLEFDSINGVPAEKLSYNSNPLIIDGDVILQGDLLVDGNVQTEKVNNLIFENEVVQVTDKNNKINGTLDFEHLSARQAVNAAKANKFPVHHNYESQQIQEHNVSLESVDFERIFLPGNLTVQTINGENFHATVSSLCLTNIKTFIPNNTIIRGDVFVKDEALTLYLNRLEYPQEYVLAKSNSFSQITGNKMFTNEVIIGELTTRGTINGIDSNDVVTLSAEQRIDGKMSFAHLEVTNGLKLDGEIIGTQPDNLLTKPTLLDAQVLSSNFNFKQLEVTGTVTIGNNYNGTNLEHILSDVVYKNMEQADVTSVKKFPFGLTVQQDLRVASNAINNVDINTLIHKDTDQILHVRELNGDVTFDNVLLKGTFGDIDILKLDQETVKLSGEQFISSEIIFEEGLLVNELDIKKSLNDLPLEQYLYANGEVNLDALNVDALVVDNLVVQENLDAQNENFDLKRFDERRFSLSKEQTVNEDFSIGSSKIQNLDPQIINGNSFEDLFDLNVYSNKIIELLFAGKLKIKELIVDDSINIEYLNGKLMKEVLKKCLSTKDEHRKLEMNFQDVRFGDLSVENFNDIEFEDFKRNLVFKDEEEVVVEGLKVHFNGFEVKNYIQTSALNQISVYDILRKNGQQEITSALVILGGVILDGDCQLNETLNRIPIDDVTNAFEVIDENSYKIKGNVVFLKAPIIRFLNTKHVNGEDLEDFMENLVYLDNNETVHLEGNITFGAPVNVKGNLHVNFDINGVDLNLFKDEVVLITQDGTIQTPVEFVNDVIVKEQLEVEGDMFTNNIVGVNPNSWLDKALLINKGKIPGELYFQSAFIENELHTKFLNNVDLTSLIPLKSENVIANKLRIIELASIQDVKVQGLVNGRKLEPEFSNSVLSGKFQQVSNNVIFQGNILVHDFLDIHNLINEHDLAKVVTTDGDQTLIGNYQFVDKTVINNDAVVHGLVNGINVTRWMHNGVKKTWPETQIISNTWTLGGNLTFDNNVNGNGVVNGLNIRKIADQVEYRRTFKYTVETELVDNYKRICTDINEVLETTRKQIYTFKHLDYKQFIEMLTDIEHVHQFEHQGEQYLFIKDKGCTTKLFVWLENSFALVQEYETGLIAQIVTVHDGDDVYLVTRDQRSLENNCTVDGTNVWKFEEDKLILIQKLNDQILLQASKLPGTFYAIEGSSVMEYKISTNVEVLIFVVQKWSVPMENAAFLAAGLKTGLSLRNGKQLIKLQREETASEEPHTDPEVNTVAIGNFTIVENHYIPGIDGEMLLLNVGHPRWKTMMAVATHEETSVRGKLDFIKIYEDPMTGRVFHKVLTYKPTSMVSLEFGENGETLLVFLENNEVLQIYEYKGIEGFKFRAKANVQGNQLVPIQLPCGSAKKPRNFIGLVHRNHFSLLEAVMDGDQLDLDQVKCTL